MKKKYYVLICILLILIGVVIGIVLFLNRPKEKALLVRHTIYIGQNGWNYSLSKEGILQAEEPFYKIGFSDHVYHKFIPVGSGEVTIYWQYYEDTEIISEYCYSTTYLVDEEGNITQISSENEPPRQNNFVAAIQEYMVSYENAIYEIILFLFGLFLDVFGLHL